MERQGRSEDKRELTPWRPSRELDRMERMVEDFFGRPWFGSNWPELFRGREFKFRGPVVELYDDKDAVVMKAELPGMRKEDLEVNVSGNFVTIRGEKKQETEEKKKGYYYSERSYGSFTRTVEIPGEVEGDKVKATFKDGLLELRFPKTEAAKKKEIKIKVQ